MDEKEIIEVDDLVIVVNYQPHVGEVGTVVNIDHTLGYNYLVKFNSGTSQSFAKHELEIFKKINKGTNTVPNNTNIRRILALQQYKGV